MVPLAEPKSSMSLVRCKDPSKPSHHCHKVLLSPDIRFTQPCRNCGLLHLGSQLRELRLRSGEKLLRDPSMKHEADETQEVKFEFRSHLFLRSPSRSSSFHRSTSLPLPMKHRTGPHFLSLLLSRRWDIKNCGPLRATSRHPATHLFETRCVKSPPVTSIGVHLAKLTLSWRRALKSSEKVPETQHKTGLRVLFLPAHVPRPKAPIPLLLPLQERLGPKVAESVVALSLPLSVSLSLFPSLSFCL